MKTEQAKAPELIKPVPTKTLEEVTPLLGWAYGAWKEYEGLKNEYKGDFYRLADLAIRRDQPARKVVTIEAPTHEKALERVERHNPGWMLQQSRNKPETPGEFEIILEEDPALQPFEHVHDGIRYARTVSKGSVMIDDEWLREEDPGLYERVTLELPWGERITVPIERLDTATIGALSKYIYNAKPTVRLAPPREVKEEA